MHAVTSNPTVHLTETTLVTSLTPDGPRTTVLSSVDSVETLPHPVYIYIFLFLNICLFIFASETRSVMIVAREHTYDLISKLFRRVQLAKVFLKMHQNLC